MRSILVTVDDNPSSLTAQRVAVTLARQTFAAVRGVTGIEVSDLEAIDSVPLGGAKQALERLKHREQLTRERRDRITELPARFERDLAKEGVTATCATMGIDIRTQILREIETCDLVITGRDTRFHCEAGSDVAPLVEHIIARGARPVVVTGPTPGGNGPVVVAYDGSTPAAKALQLAALLGVFHASDAYILSIGEDRAQASAVAARAGEYLQRHGVVVDLVPSVSAKSPTDLLLRRCEELEARMLVMGAYGHRGWRDFLFGSTTSHLLESASLPLFIHH